MLGKKLGIICNMLYIVCMWAEILLNDIILRHSMLGSKVGLPQRDRVNTICYKSA